MALSIGDSKVSKLYLGDTECKKAYLGDTLVMDNSISYNSIEWSQTSSFPAYGSYANAFSSVTYGENGFVVVGGYNGENGYLANLYSTDGINFVRTSSGSNNNILMKVAYGSSRYAAVGYVSGTTPKPLIMTSETGSKNWYKRNPPSGLLQGNNKNLFALCYGANKFVSFQSSGNQSVYSEDGIIWNLSALPITSLWNAIAYGGGKFIAVSNGADSVYSNDGINWAVSKLPSSKNWFSIAYGGNKFVTLANASDKAAYSYDGINWSEFSLPISDNWISVAYGDGIFVAIAYGSSKFIYSKDGLNWETNTMPSSRYWKSITYGDGKFIAIAASANSGAYGIPK